MRAAGCPTHRKVVGALFFPGRQDGLLLCGAVRIASSGNKGEVNQFSKNWGSCGAPTATLGMGTPSAKPSGIHGLRREHPRRLPLLRARTLWARAWSAGDGRSWLYARIRFDRMVRPAGRSRSAGCFSTVGILVFSRSKIPVKFFANFPP